ncbi:MAG TPA: NAD-dependent epimerase/dehydratase family protein [Alphaproteobacteria bacterium]|jgi:dTDP-4-dehydrorhamnose reductase|nr:NAD-dependent epimerase/dehydratase family protein [Alphaproteobacteria bacterium]
MKIFLTGGSGNLGKALVEKLKTNHNVLYPSHLECDILNFSNLKNTIVNFKPDIVIHLAALVDTFDCEKDIERALNINVSGTINMVNACLSLNCKFIYKSSEYVFSGKKGNYNVTDLLDPINVYGKTKAASEYIVSTLPNYQIIRAPFIREIYKKVFTNQYCSRYFIEDVVDRIIDNIFNNSKKIIHISNYKDSLYNHYLKKGIEVEPIKMSDNFKKVIPKDSSLINTGI